MSKNVPSLSLYVTMTCPFCIKVLRFMTENQINITVLDVQKDPDALAELRSLTGKRQVPCLRIDDSGMLESDDIIEKLKELYR